MVHHDLDPYPIPREKAPLYINEPELIDKSLELCMSIGKLEKQEDNIRVYIPLDISKDVILRRLDRVIMQYGEATEKTKWNLVSMSGCLSRRSRSMTRYGMDGMLWLKESIVRKKLI